jgi:hypothetical protein
MNASTERLLPLLVVAAALSSGACTPRAGHVRFQNPTSREVAGGDERVTPGGPGLFFDGKTPSESISARNARERVARAASDVVGKQHVVVAGKSYRADCSGTARGIYASAGLPLGGTASEPGENDVSIIYRWVKENGSLRTSRPLPGDLVFFDDSYDRNGDGRVNDPLSHIGVVEKVLDDGTVVFVHRVGGAILRYRMNLDRPRERKDNATGQRLNHILRRGGGSIDAATTGELFVAYGTIVVSENPTLVANR